MPKSDRIVISKRVREVERLIVAGAEVADIERFSIAQGWNVGCRQIRRYVNLAYERLSKAAKRNRRQLLGRHVTQRRALYAHSLKANDIRTALHVLKDEAALEGLYPSANGTSDEHDCPRAIESPLSLRERVSRCLAAQFSDDATEVQIVEHLSPQMVYEFYDTEFPIAFLHMLAMRHSIEQLEMLVLFHQASAFLAEAAIDDDGRHERRMWQVMKVAAYRIRVGAEAWTRFTAEIGVDGQALIAANNSTGMLTAKEEFICQMAPPADELPDLVARLKCTVEDLPNVESSTRYWKKLYAAVLHE